MLESFYNFQAILMNNLKKQKIYYTHGIISLIILPIMFTKFVDIEIRKRKLTILPIVFADTNLPKLNPEIFSQFNNAFPPKRNYISILLNGNKTNNQIKLDFAQIQIREILSRNDTVNGIHFKFSNDSEYGSFVQTVDILQTEHAKTYMPLDSDLWFYHFQSNGKITSKSNTDSIGFMCGLICDTFTEVKEANSLMNIKWITKTWKSSWEIILAFSLFMVTIKLLKPRNIHE